jgi:flagellar biosynthesis protein FlhB
MSGGGGGGEKTEKPTPKKLQQGRKEGQIPRTQDLSAWVGVAVAAMLVPLAFHGTKETFDELFHALPGLIAHPEPSEAMRLFGLGFKGAALAVAPMCGGAMVAAFVATAAQGGITLTTKTLKPKFSKLNPLKGAKNTFGPHGLWEGAKTLIKVTVLSLVLWNSVRGTAVTLLSVGQMPLSAVVGSVLGALTSILWAAVATGLALAAVDYAVVRRRINKQLRMSHQDIKEESRQSEGDPQLKGAIRSKQFAMSRNRMMADVANADVVLVNPTHVSVALRYDPAKGAPRVVAKGAGTVAAKIRERATEHRVPLVENKPLARALHRGCEIGAEIPPELYQAVAQVLAFVLNLRARGSSAGLHRPAHLVDEGLNSFTGRPNRKSAAKA